MPKKIDAEYFRERYRKNKEKINFKRRKKTREANKAIEKIAKIRGILDEG